MSMQSPPETTGIARDVEPPVTGADGIDGERGISSVNARPKRKSGSGMQLAIVVAVTGLALLLAGAYYWPQLHGQSVPARANGSGVQIAARADSELTPPSGKSPTEVKAQVDAEAKLKADAATAKAAGATVLASPDAAAASTPPIALAGAKATPGALDTPEDAAAKKKAAEEEVLRLRRIRSPLLAVDTRDNGASPASQVQGGLQSAEQPGVGTASRVGVEGGTRITMDQAMDMASKAIAAQKAAAAGSGPAGRDAGVGFSVGGGGAGFGGGASADGPRSELAAKIQPTTVAMVSATTLPNRDLILTQGTFIDCTLETALDSTVAGFSRCVTTRNLYSNSGRVILMERGTKIIGQYQGGIKQGQSRIFVLWTRAETPHGVVISLDSPGTDALGGSGLPGEIDTKFWARFGGALLLSIIQDSFDVLKREVTRDEVITTTNTQNAGKNAAGIALENSINIPPVLYKNQGEKINITVARDLDFSSVYALRLSDR